jgi:putative RecB family exonuclease
MPSPARWFSSSRASAPEGCQRPSTSPTHPRRTLGSMALPLPSSLSPSKVSRFTECALAFRFSAIDRIPEPPSPHAVKGTLVHGALERLFWDLPKGSRSLESARRALELSWDALASDPEVEALGLGPEEEGQLLTDALCLVERYFLLEDPDSVDAAGIELLLEAEAGGVTLRGIIDRLDVTSSGDLVVVDYKTGRVPSEIQERSRLGAVHFYALLCEEVLGVRPALVRLMYLREPVVIETAPSDQALTGLRRRTAAVWKAIERSCAEEDFRPKPGPLCGWCSFKDLCPVFGGDPSLTRTKSAPSALAVAR